MKPTCPGRYKFGGRYGPHSRWMGRMLQLGSVILWVVSGWLLLFLNNVIRPEFDGFDFLHNLIFGSNRGKSLIITCFALLLIVLYMYVHELIHGLFIWTFSRKRPLFSFNIRKPYAALAPGAFITRNNDLIAMYSPLIIITLTGLIVWPIVPMQAIPAVILIISVNIGASISDIVQSIWLIRFDKNSVVGFDGKGSIVCEP